VSYRTLSNAAYRKAMDEWLADLIKEAADYPRPLHPAIRNFQNFIETNADIYVLFAAMFMSENSRKKHYLNKAVGLFQHQGDRPKVQSYQHMLELLNVILTKAPEYRATNLIRTLPILSLLGQFAQTEAGSAVFLNEKVNEQIQLLLDAWGRFLSSGESCSVLNTNPRTGWLGEDAMNSMPDFDRDFVCDPAAPHYGFRSWDDFFTRQLKPGARPISSPDDDFVIVNACESAPHNPSSSSAQCPEYCHVQGRS